LNSCHNAKYSGLKHIRITEYFQKNSLELNEIINKC
jgi:hypothetical protein